MAKPTQAEIDAKEAARQQAIAQANAARPAPPVPEIEMKSEEPPPPDPPLSPGVEAQRAAILVDDSDPKADAKYADRVAAAQTAVEKLKKIFGGYSPTAPNEHIVFGNGAGTFTLGDLRALMADE